MLNHQVHKLDMSKTLTPIPLKLGKICGMSAEIKRNLSTKLDPKMMNHAQVDLKIDFSIHFVVLFAIIQGFPQDMCLMK